MAISFIISNFVSLVFWVGFAYLLLSQILVIPTINIRDIIFHSAVFRWFFETQLNALHEEIRQFRLLHGLTDDSEASPWDTLGDEWEDEEGHEELDGDTDIEEEVQGRNLDYVTEVLVARDGWEQIIDDEGADGLVRLLRNPRVQDQEADEEQELIVVLRDGWEEAIDEG